MEASSFEKLFSDQWKSSTSAACQSLEAEDLRHVSIFNSWEDTQRQMVRSYGGQQTISQELALLIPASKHLKTFTDSLDAQVEPKLDTSVFWGLFGLIVKLAKEEEGAMSCIPRMLRELCHKVELLNKYGDNKSYSVHQTKEASFEITLTLLAFFSCTITYVRSNDRYTHSDSPNNEWQPLEQQFDSAARVIDESISRVEKFFKLTKRSDRLDEIFKLQSTLSLQKEPVQPHNAASSQTDDDGKRPCTIFPSFRTSRFFDRTDTFQKIKEHFSQVDADQSFRSLALYGLGGVGKSSVALRYAETKLREGELDAMFWVQSEKLVNIRQSFTDIALRLKLPGAKPEEHDDNLALVLNYLQHTQSRWLLVYDNAESVDLILPYWPAATRGQALITTRNPSFAFGLADGGLEVKSWDAQTGCKFLLHLLSTDIGTQLAAGESQSATELSHKLSGHALAISHMAGLIHERAWSISEFVEIYNQQPEKMHGISGNGAINALWDLSFRSLDKKGSTIMGVLCFVAPDSIPEALFETGHDVELPQCLQFCAERLRYLLETNEYNDLEDLINVNTLAFGTLPHHEQTIYLEAPLASYKGQLLNCLGKPSEGEVWLRKCCSLRAQAVPPKPWESTFSAKNLANGIATNHNFPEAIMWHKHARDFWYQWCDEKGLEKNTPFELKTMMGITLIWAGHDEEARDILNQALRQIESTEPYNWAMAAK
ncbi:MAG: hypothetical protein Q9172_001711 [Xanthocarpia lactea]